MALLDVRKQFVKLSGRYDLVQDATTWADNGADWFINAGQKYLDRSLDNTRFSGRYYTTLEQGQNAVFVPTCRAVREVWINRTSDRIKLEEAFARDLRLLLDQLIVTNSDVGLPKYYAPIVSRLLTTADPNYVPGIFADATYSNEDFSALFFGINAEDTYALEVQGLFYSPKLTADDSMSYWTESQDDILVQASLMRLEAFYRNFEGVKDSKAMVDILVAQLDMDSVAQEIANIAQIGG